jgi:hypothetical protein
MGPWGSNPGPPHRPSTLTKSALAAHQTLLLINYMNFNLFEFILYGGQCGGPGWGLAPAPGHTHFTYDPTL